MVNIRGVASKRRLRVAGVESYIWMVTHTGNAADDLQAANCSNVRTSTQSGRVQVGCSELSHFCTVVAHVRALQTGVAA